MSRPAPPPQIVASAADAAALFEPLFAEGGFGTIAVIHLDSERRLLGLGQYPVAAEEMRLPTRAILSDGLRLGAEGMILAHRRSGAGSGDEAESQETRELAEVARSLGIELHDRLVFADGGCESYRGMGLL